MLKELCATNSTNPPSCIIVPEINASYFELKPHNQSITNFLRFGKRELLYAHYRFLDIYSTFKFRNFTDDSVQLYLFSFSLKDMTKAWLNLLLYGVITSWVLTQKFLSKFFHVSNVFSLKGYNGFLST